MSSPKKPNGGNGGSFSGFVVRKLRKAKLDD
jgi:hypothetical protein